MKLENRETVKIKWVDNIVSSENISEHFSRIFKNSYNNIEYDDNFEDLRCEIEMSANFDIYLNRINSINAGLRSA